MLATLLPQAFSDNVIALNTVVAASGFTGLGFTDATVEDIGASGVPVFTDDANLDPHDISIVAGLAVTSHDTGALHTSTFDHVLVTSSGGAYGNDDVGDVGHCRRTQRLERGRVYTLFLVGANLTLTRTEEGFNKLTRR